MAGPNTVGIGQPCYPVAQLPTWFLVGIADKQVAISLKLGMKGKPHQARCGHISHVDSCERLLLQHPIPDDSLPDT